MRLVLFSVLALVVNCGFLLDFEAAIQKAEGYGKSDLGQDPERIFATFHTSFVDNTSDLGHTSFQGSLFSSSYCSSCPFHCQDELLNLDMQALLCGQQRGGELLPSMRGILGVLVSEWRWWISEARWSATVANLAEQWQSETLSQSEPSRLWTWWTRTSTQVSQEAERWWRQRREECPQEPQESFQGPREGQQLLQRAKREGQRSGRRTSLGAIAAAPSPAAGTCGQCRSPDCASRSAVEIYGQDYLQGFGLLPCGTSRRSQKDLETAGAVGPTRNCTKR